VVNRKTRLVGRVEWAQLVTKSLGSVLASTFSTSRRIKPVELSHDPDNFSFPFAMSARPEFTCSLDAIVLTLWPEKDFVHYSVLAILAS
jgi:hypothetical protein